MIGNLYICGEIAGIDPPVTKRYQASFSSLFCLVLLNSLVMKTIPLTQGKSTLIDDWNYDWLNQWKWFAVKVKEIYYAGRHPSRSLGKRKIIWMHREILGLPDNLMVDHRNNNGLDNQEHNLRPATNQQNQWNCKKRGKGKYRGVTYSNNSGKKNPFIVHLKIGGKVRYMGNFNSEEAAARHYDKMVKLYHGEFAVLNFNNPQK